MLAATAAMVALAYGARRWWASLLGVLLVIAMAVDRMYLQVHYPSDVLAGFIMGFIGGIIGYAIVQGIFRLLDMHPDQIARRKYEASRHAQVAIPRGPEMQYAQVQMPQATNMPYTAAAMSATAAFTQVPSQQAVAQQGVAQQAASPGVAGPAPAPSRYAEHAQAQTLQTSAGATVVVPGVPVQQASPGETQLIDMPDGETPEPGRSTSESGFQMVEEYYQE